MTASAPSERLRLDKWLWAARFFKTRSLAAQAVEGGRVRLNDERTKPGHVLKLGDALTIHIAEYEWQVVVRVLSDHRGPAPVARTLYEDDPQSAAKRQQQMEARKLQAEPAQALRGRPTKKDRRAIERQRRGA